MADTQQYPQIETLIPHRGRMLLVDEIVSIDTDAAVSRTTVKSQWPFIGNDGANPLLIVELVAQTSGLSNGLTRLKTEGVDTDTKGWLVGIKKAVFHVDTLALGAVIETYAKNSFKFDGFREIEGFSKIGLQVVGEVILQVMRADKPAFLK